MNRPLLKERRTWTWLAVFWGLIVVGSWLADYWLSVGRPDDPMTVGRAAARLVYSVPWFGATLLAVWMSESFTIRHPRQYIGITLQLVVGAGLAAGWAVLAYYLSLALIPGWQPVEVRSTVIASFMAYFFYIAVLVVMHCILFARESRAEEITALQLAKTTAQAHLRVLKMELQPHSLFNTLHAISALMHRDVRDANKLLVLLADMLDGALQAGRDQEVTLREELDLLKLYIHIQQIRFGSRLKVNYAIDPNALDARVPHMTLQPLVENAIKHGIETRAAGGQLGISAQVSEQDLKLAVRDDGPGPGGAHPVYGLDLTNIQERLGYLYGEHHRFELGEAPGGGARVTISIPLTKAESLNPTA